MKKNPSFLRQLLTPDSGISSKRFMALIVSFVIVFISLVDLFSNYSVSAYVFEGLVWLAAIGWGTVVAEKFGYKGLGNATNEIDINSNIHNIEELNGKTNE